MVTAAIIKDVMNTIVAAKRIGLARNVFCHFSIASVAPVLVDTQAASIRNEYDNLANEKLTPILF